MVTFCSKWPLAAKSKNYKDIHTEKITTTIIEKPFDAICIFSTNCSVADVSLDHNISSYIQIMHNNLFDKENNMYIINPDPPIKILQMIFFFDIIIL